MIQKLVKKQDSFADSPVEKAGEMLREPVREVAHMPKTIFDNALEQIGVKPRRAPMSGTIEVIRRQVQAHAAAVEQMANQERKTETQVQPNKYESSGRQFQAQKNQEKVIFNQKQSEIQKQISQILGELKIEVVRLGSQAKALSSDISKITVESMPAGAGVYHINFLEALTLEIRNLRRKVTNSRLWLDVAYAKKKKKGFWQMAKKHGNQFLLSDERTAGYGAG